MEPERAPQHASPDPLSADGLLLCRVSDGIWRLTFNRPEIRNAFTDLSSFNNLVDALDTIENDPTAIILIITGSGTAFSSGGNLETIYRQSDTARNDPRELRQYYQTGVHRVISRLYSTDLVTLAAINGPAIGAGLDIAAMCDLRIAGDAARFGETFVTLGMVSGDGGSWILPRVVNPQLATEMTLTGRILDAREALAAGFVLSVVPTAALAAASEELAFTIASMPRHAVRMNKRLLRQSRETRFSDALELAVELQLTCQASSEHQAAVERFTSRRRKHEGRQGMANDRE